MGNWKNPSKQLREAPGKVAHREHLVLCRWTRSNREVLLRFAQWRRPFHKKLQNSFLKKKSKCFEMERSRAHSLIFSNDEEEIVETFSGVEVNSICRHHGNRFGKELESMLSYKCNPYEKNLIPVKHSTYPFSWRETIRCLSTCFYGTRFQSLQKTTSANRKEKKLWFSPIVYQWEDID